MNSCPITNTIFGASSTEISESSRRYVFQLFNISYELVNKASVEFICAFLLYFILLKEILLKKNDHNSKRKTIWKGIASFRS